ncbi:MAG: putative endopeptidase [bacterium]|jgi:putative endopeptidase
MSKHRKMKQLKVVAITAVLLIGLQSITKDKPGDKSNPKAFDLKNINAEENACGNFYGYAIGNWQKMNPIPPTEGRWMSFNVLAQENRDKIQGILDQALLSKNPVKGTDLQLIQDFYKSALDTETRNKRGYEPLKPMLEYIDNIMDTRELNMAFVKLRKMRVSTPVALHVGVDPENSREHIINASQSGLTLGDKTYYLKEELKFVEIRVQYVEHIQDIFNLAGIEAENSGNRILDLETRLAAISWDRKDLRDADKTYNRMHIDEFDNGLLNLDIKGMLTEMGLRDVVELVVGQVSFYEELDMLMHEVTLEDWKLYLKWHVFSSFSAHINEEFEQKSFEFFSMTLQGVKEMRPKKERILRTIDGNLSEPLGKLFVQQYFPKESKEYMSELIENLRGAYKESIDNLTWMGDSTKAKAQKKLASFTYKIGYPDEWKDYSKLDILPNEYLQNILNLAAFRYDQMIDKYGKQVNKKEWHMSPQMVNAYYNRSGNEIVFPAGIFQPPFFHPTFDDAINYGGIGAVIGHEFTHGFDDQGAKYDWDGNKNDWWTAEDKERFNALTKRLAEQYSSYEVLPGEFVNGQLTLGENIADLGGLTLAYMACEKVMATKDDPMIDGFTWQQRFFLGWANVWKGNITDEALRNRILTDPHSPGEQRVIGPLVNIPAFQEAFGCAGSLMSKPPEEQIKIW